MSSSAAKPSHVTESIADRKKSRELAEARQSGAVAPAVDVKTGNMINPHNPEFITKRPWYLGSNDDGPSLDHQNVSAAQSSQESGELSMNKANQFVQTQRQVEKEARKKGKFQVGMWVEAIKHGKGPYKICQIIKIAKKGKQFDLKYEDGTIERNIKFKQSSSGKGGGIFKPRIRMTVTGSRSVTLDEKKFGKQTYDSKRDKYHGYDQESHTQRVSKLFQQREDIRKNLREQKRINKQEEGNTEGGEGDGDKKGNDKKKEENSDSDVDSDVDDSGGDDSEDEFVQKDEDDKIITTRLARQGGVGGAQMKVTARNLRIREDTAKYLRNLDPNSAYYDPKSRSMRDNPNPELAEPQFAGDNFARISGDAIQFAETQLFAWDAANKISGGSGDGGDDPATASGGGGTDAADSSSLLHPQANPSQVEVLKKKYQSKSAELQLQKKKKVLQKYGGAEYLDGSGGLASAVGAAGSEETQKQQQQQQSNSNDRKIRFGVSTEATEYLRDGRILKGPGGKGQQKQQKQKSKYEEDVFTNGHVAVWGSYFHIGGFCWGYGDDHSLIKNSYGTGENGRIANDQANEMRFGTGVAGSAALAQARGMLKAIPKQQGNNNPGGIPDPTKRSKLYGEADQKVELDTEKVRAALRKAQEEAADDENDDDKNANKKKRKYNSMDSNIDVSQEEMEAYRLRKERSSDPMANIGNDEILEYKK